VTTDQLSDQLRPRRRIRVEDSAGNPEINRENQRRQRKLLDKVADLDFPQNPMDALIAHFGVDSVAEISGGAHSFEGRKCVRHKIRGVPQRPLHEHETRLDLPCVLLV